MDKDENICSDRVANLLEKAATELREGRQVPSGHFLREHNVEASEVFDLTDVLADIVEGFLEATPQIQAAIITMSAVKELNIPPNVIMQNAIQAQALKDLNEKLAQIRKEAKR